MTIFKVCRPLLGQLGRSCGRFYHTGQVRVRFAPSPTGFLHLGGLRTALYNFLFAKSHNGKFILRIEDTDQTRIVQGAVDELQKDLIWAGVNIEEGPNSEGEFGPYVQSQRLQIYRDHVQTLLTNGMAYRCFCTDKRLELLRKEALRLGEVPKYDNRCRNLTAQDAQNRLNNGQPSCIRFKLTSGVHKFHDLVYGEIAYDVTANEGDPVIIKSDGFPTYHFANVVDDHCMEISHVLRGVEWQISTTKHLMMYRAFNWKPPAFAHLPLLVNADGTKLSKRQGDIRIGHYRDSGIFPLALVNFIANAGGGFEKDAQRHLKPQIYSLAELTKQFDIGRINPHSSSLMPERLLEFNRLELKRQLETNSAGELIDEVKRMVELSFPKEASDGSLETSAEHILYILNWCTDRISKLQDLVSDDLKFVWLSPKTLQAGEQDLSHLTLLVERLTNCEDLTRNGLNSLFKQFCKDHGIKFSAFMTTLRSILSGLKEGPSVAEMVAILGKETTIKRLRGCLNNK